MSHGKKIMLLTLIVATVIGCRGETIPDAAVSSPVIGELRLIPAGDFARDADRKNISRITAPFYIAEKEITYPEFRDVTGLSIPNNAMNDTPVKYVNWYHALIFCNALSAREGLTPVYSIGGSADPADWLRLVGGTMPTGHSADKRLSPVVADWDANGYRLPTEMEWTWAAMGAKKTAKGYEKAFSGSTGKNRVDDYAWIQRDGNGSSHPVGTKLPNEVGLFDMSGNVMEWCWDWYGEYPRGTIKSGEEPGRGASTGTGRVVRGGSWRDELTSLDFRCGSCPFDQDHYVGFRVVRSVARRKP